MPTMLEPLLEAAIHWMRAGMPLSLLKIVIGRGRNTDDALQIFREARSKWNAPLEKPKAQDFDVFISYAREDERAVDVLASHLRDRSLSVFLDRQALQEGAAWQHRIFSSIDRCKRLIAFYSPEYVGSKVCQEEFNIAWARGRQLDRDVIFPIYWRSADLPTYMTLLLYADCREQQTELLRQACGRVADSCA